jgi:phospholipid/cholesterol/gamma-HCH transport system permease protein
MNGVGRALAQLGRFGIFSGQVGWRILSPRWEISEAARHTYLITIRCLLPVVAVIFPFGMVMALQGLTIFDMFGAQRLLSSLISVAVFRELAPVLAGVLVAAQGGSAFAAELGAMRIREEIDATVVMAIDPIRVHVVPRVVATVIAAPMLTTVGALSGILGGYASAVWVQGESGPVYMANVWAFTSMFDIIGGMIKAVVFGAIIGLTACFYGFNASGGAAGVGKAVNDTVVMAATGFIIVNYFLTSALFGVIQ